MSMIQSMIQPKLWAKMLVLAGLLTACTLPLVALPTGQQPTQSPVTPTMQPDAPVVQVASSADRTLLPTATPASVPESVQESIDVADEGPTQEQQQLLDSLKNQGPAPELTNEIWLNSPALTLADLRGKVVIVEFWTFGCINCIHQMPTIQAWHEQYADQGLVVIGVHSPEFEYEKNLDNVQRALVDQAVSWPVAIDNEFVTWRAYSNHYWPAAYFIDKQGNIRLVKIGEGQYAYAEQVIQALLAEPAAS